MQLYTEEFIYQVLFTYADREKLSEKHKKDFYDIEVDMFDWCDETFGEQEWVNEYRESYDAHEFHFKKEEHRTWFIMRWS